MDLLLVFKRILWGISYLWEKLKRVEFNVSRNYINMTQGGGNDIGIFEHLLI